MTSSAKDKIPFQKLSAQETTQLLQDMSHSLPEVVLSAPKGAPVRIRLISVEALPSARAYVAENLSASLSAQSTYILNFGMKEGVYFLRSTVTKDTRGTFLDFSGDIFKFQRRENFRCPIPPSVPSSVKVFKSKDSAPHPEAVRLRDLSGRGLALSLSPNPDATLWRKPAEVFLDVNILQLSLSGIKAIIRHVQLGEDPWVGLELPNLSFSEETDLSSTSLHLQRILFQGHLTR